MQPTILKLAALGQVAEDLLNKFAKKKDKTDKKKTSKKKTKTTKKRRSADKVKTPSNKTSKPSSRTSKTLPEELIDKHVARTYEPLYNTFDKGHSPEHMREVLQKATLLARTHAPNDTYMVGLAAKLHDVGLRVARKDHEKHGWNIVRKDPFLQTHMHPAQLRRLSLAIKNHRASTGNPRDILGKIVSDADRDVDPYRAFSRSYFYGKTHFPELTEAQHVRRSVEHPLAKYHQIRTFFPETQAQVQAMLQALRDPKQVEIFRRRAQRENS